jgi:hypothetical protein
MDDGQPKRRTFALACSRSNGMGLNESFKQNLLETIGIAIALESQAQTHSFAGFVV